MGGAGKEIFPASLQNQSSDSLIKGFGNAEERNDLNLDLKLGISDIYSSAKEKLATPPGSSVKLNTNQTGEGQTSKPGLNLKAKESRDDPKRLKRILSNRNSARNYRMRKNLHMNYMEEETLALEIQISKLCLEINETKNEKQSLLLEQHQLKLKMAACEKKRIMTEVEIQKNMEEMNRLGELYRTHLEAKQQLEDGNLPAQLDLNL